MQVVYIPVTDQGPEETVKLSTKKHGLPAHGICPCSSVTERRHAKASPPMLHPPKHQVTDRSWSSWIPKYSSECLCVLRLGKGRRERNFSPRKPGTFEHHKDLSADRPELCRHTQHSLDPGCLPMEVNTRPEP